MTTDVDLIVNDGVDWWVQLVYTDANGNAVNVTSPRMEVRASAATNGTLMYSSESPTTPVLSLGTTSGSGGSFAAGTYFWKVTALSAVGETLASNEVTATIALNGTQVLNWAAVTGATGYKVYRATSAGGETGATSLVTTLGAVTTYTDTGTATTTGSVPAADSSKSIVISQPNGNTVKCSIASSVTKNKIAGETGYWDCYATDPNGLVVQLGRGGFSTVPNTTAL